MTAPSAVYVWCPSCLAGRAEIDPSHPDDIVQCDDSGGTNCDAEFAPEPDAFAKAMTDAGYVNDENHGWVDPTDTSWWLDCNPCYYGWSHTEGPPERRGRWE